MIKKIILFLLSLVFINSVMADAMIKTENVAMADQLRQDGKIYVVVVVLLILFIGIASYLWIIDKKIARLENELKNK